MVVKGNSDDLLSRFHLLHNLEIDAVKDLNVALVEGDYYKLVVSACVKHFELACHLGAQL